MLLDDYERVSQAESIEGLKKALIAFAEGMDFPLVNVSLVIEQSVGPNICLNISNTPAAFLNASHSREDGLRDPVLRRVRKQSTPVIYDQDLYTSEGAGDLWETQAQFGFRAGLGVALHLPQGRHLVVGMDRDRRLPKGAKLARMLADLNLLAAHTQDAAFRLLLPQASPVAEAIPQLTPREFVIVRLLVRGESNKSIASELRVSDNTIEFHLKNVFRKLDCRSRGAAISKALQYGLL